MAEHEKYFSLKKNAQNNVKNPVSDPSRKNQKLGVSLNQQSDILYSLFLCMSKSMTTKIY